MKRRSKVELFSIVLGKNQNMETVAKRIFRKGEAKLLWQMLKKKFPELDNSYYDKIKELD